MKKRTIVILAVILVLAALAVTVAVAISKVQSNLDQLTELEVSNVDLSTARDGVYTGSYSVFPVSVEVKVTIHQKAIEGIEILKHDNGQGQGAEAIPQKVVDAQSLEVDAISGATYSSKVFLLAIHDALVKAGAEPVE